MMAVAFAGDGDSVDGAETPMRVIVFQEGEKTDD